MQQVLPSFIMGCVWGLAVSLLNNFWSNRALRDAGNKKSVFFFACRQGINLIAMVLVYKNIPMLIGTALGLLAVKNYILIQCLFDMKKQKRKG